MSRFWLDAVAVAILISAPMLTTNYEVGPQQALSTIGKVPPRESLMHGNRVEVDRRSKAIASRRAPFNGTKRLEW